MNYLTCYRCPLRNVNGVRCDLLQAKANVLKGHGFTSAKWVCERRLALFSPGDVVTFKIHEMWDGDGSKTYFCHCTGVVMRMGPYKALVCVTSAKSERGTNDPIQAPMMWLRHDGLTKTGEREVVCIHCGKPKNRNIQNWDCGEWHEDTGTWSPCEYPTEGAQ